MMVVSLPVNGMVGNTHATYETSIVSVVVQPAVGSVTVNMNVALLSESKPLTVTEGLLVLAPELITPLPAGLVVQLYVTPAVLDDPCNCMDWLGQVYETLAPALAAGGSQKLKGA